MLKIEGLVGFCLNTLLAGFYRWFKSKPISALMMNRKERKNEIEEKGAML